MKQLKENEKMIAEGTNWEQQANNNIAPNSTASLVMAPPPRPPLPSRYESLSHFEIS